MTLEELKARLGPIACQAAREIAAAAPPLTPQQHAELAVLLRRPRQVTPPDEADQPQRPAA